MLRTAAIDTCCLINLHASGRAGEILHRVFAAAVIPEQVLGESLFVLRPDEDEGLVPQAVDLSTLIAAGVIRTVGFDRDVEVERFVQLAMELDDGEAACLAIAASRGLWLATDDRKAIRIAGELMVEVITTPEILMCWVEHAAPPRGEVRDVIRHIERFGRFRPHPSSSHADWWDEQG